jgi:DNA-directed RNA polymerase specialized sigma subunit
MKTVENKLMLEKLFNMKFSKANCDSREMLERNVEIFVARYAYDMTLTDIAKEYNLSVARVQGIIAKLHRNLNKRAKVLGLA